MHIRKPFAMLLACALIFTALPVSLLAEELPVEDILMTDADDSAIPDEPEILPTKEPEAEPTIETEIEPTAEPETDPTQAPETAPSQEPEIQPTEEPDARDSSDFVIDGSGKLTKYNGSDAHVVIPDGVITIGNRAFTGNEWTASARPHGIWPGNR